MSKCSSQYVNLEYNIHQNKITKSKLNKNKKSYKKVIIGKSLQKPVTKIDLDTGKPINIDSEPIENIEKKF